MGPPLFEYFVVCGIGPDIKTLDGIRGFYGIKYKYDSSFIDQFPPPGHSLYPDLPPQLPKCVLPAGVEFHESESDAYDFSSYPRNYPVVLTGSGICSSTISWSSHLARWTRVVTANIGSVAHVADTNAWPVLENIAQINNMGYEHYVELRGYLSYIHQLNMIYRGISNSKVQSPSFHSLQSPRSQDGIYDRQKHANESASASNWVKSMFGGGKALEINSYNHAGGLAAETETSGQKKIQSNVRVLRGHGSAITALHCVTRRDVWDLVADREDSGFFISGSTDCSVRIWDPSRRGSELLATMRGHTGAVRAISSYRWKVVSGSDDLSILVWDKNKCIPLEELKGHKALISYVRILSGERVLSSAHDGTVKMWDARVGSCIATVAHCPGAVLCMEYDDTTGILAAAGRDSIVHIWDIRAGKHIHKLQGHTQWIRTLRMVGDNVITGSDNWTARVWSISSGACDAVLPHHAGPVRCVECSGPDDGIITGSDDGFVRFWENAAGDYNNCAKDMFLQSPILSTNASGKWLAIGTADNSMLLLNQPEDTSSGLPKTARKSEGWQVYRTARASATVIRCVA